jgi:hypothetical protein
VLLLFLSDRYLIGMSLWLVAGGVTFWLLLRLRSMWRDKPRRITCLNAGLSLWMTLAALTSVELYFALIYDASDSFNMTNVSKKWFALHVQPQKKFLTVNPKTHEGIWYRDDRAYPEALRPDQKHVVFFGDSFTFAQGVNDVKDRFSNRVRDVLERDSNGKIVVSNVADAGTDLRWIKKLSEEMFENGHKIDTMVYVLCLNDIESYHERHETYYQDLSRHNPQFFLFRDTYFFNWVYFRLRQFTVPAVSGYYSFVKDYYSGGPWQFMSAEIADVHRTCQAHGADFRVVIFPFLHNLGPEYPFRDVHRQIVEYCESQHIRALDLEPFLTPSAAKGLTVNRFDAHPNERAHQLAADALLKKLLDDFGTHGNPPPDGT